MADGFLGAIVWIVTKILDIVATILTIAGLCVGLLAFWNIPSFCEPIDDKWAFYALGVKAFALALTDYIVVLPCFILCTALPTRTCHFWREMTSGSSKDEWEFRSYICAEACGGLIDIPFLLFGIASALMPTRTYAFFAIVCCRDSHSCYWFHEEARCLCLFNFCVGLADTVFFVPMGFLSLFRICFWWEEFSNITHHDDNFHYTWEYRELAAVNGMLMIVDIFFLPMIVICFCARYRWQKIMDEHEIYKRNNDEKAFLKLRWELFKSTAIVLTDLLLLPGKLLVRCTYRGRFITKEYNWNPGMLVDREWDSGTRRWHVIRQTWNLLLDLPFLIVSLLPVITLYRIDKYIKAWQGFLEERDDRLKSYADCCCIGCLSAFDLELRWMLLMQPAYVLLDLACLLPFSLLLATLYRFPSVLSLLKAKLSTHVKEVPSCTLLQASSSFPESGGPKFMLMVSKPANLVFSKMRMQVLGQDFWKTAEASLGTLAKIGQGQLPMNLDDKINTEYGDFRKGDTETHFHITFEHIKIKRTTIEKKLLTLDERATMLIQIEGLAGSEWRVLACLPLQIQTLTALAKGGEQCFFGPDAKTSFYDAALVDTLQNEPVKDLRDSFWSIVLVEFAGLLKDLAYFLMFFALFLVPWRLIACLVALCEDKRRWPLRVGSKILNLLTLLDHEWDAFRGNLIPALNDDMKTMAVESGFRGNNRPYWWYPEVVDVRKMSKFEKTYLWKWKKISRGIEKRLDSMSDRPPYAEKVLDYLHRCKASLHFAVLPLAFHNARLSQRLTMDAYAMYVIKCISAEEAMHKALSELREEIQEDGRQYEDDIYSLGSKKWGIWRKDFSVQEEIILGCFQGAVMDLVTFFLLILLICTLYRIPRTLQELSTRNAYVLCRFNAKDIIAGQCWALLMDLKFLGELQFNVFIISITLIHSLEFWGLAMQEPDWTGVLRLSRRLRNETAADILFFVKTVLFAVNTYMYLLGSVLFGALVPAASFNELFSRCMGENPCTYCLSFTMWGGLLALPFIFTRHVLPDLLDSSDEMSSGDFDTAKAWVVGLCAAFASAPAMAALVRACTTSKDFSAEGKYSMAVRLTWPNFLAALMVALEAVQLVAATLFLARGSGDSLGEVADALQWTLLLGDGALYTPATWAAFGCICVWFMTISLPLVVEELFHVEEEGTFHASPAWNILHYLFGTMLFSTIIVCILKPVSCSYDGTARKAFTFTDSSEQCFTDYFATVSLVSLCFYILTTQIQLEVPEKFDWFLDIRYHRLYTELHQLLVFGYFVTCFFCAKEAGTIISFVFSIAMIFWALFFGGVGTCSVPWWGTLRLTALLGVALTSLLATLKVHAGLDVGVALPAAWGALAALGAAATAYSYCHTQRQIAQSFAEGRLQTAIADLVSVKDRYMMVESLSCEPDFIEEWQKRVRKVRSLQRLALLVLEFEEHVLYERLSTEFLLQRGEFRTALLRNDVTLDQIVSRVNQLRDGSQTPPNVFNQLQAVDSVFELPRTIQYEIGMFLHESGTFVRHANLMFVTLPVTSKASLLEFYSLRVNGMMRHLYRLMDIEKCEEKQKQRHTTDSLKRFLRTVEGEPEYFYYHKAAKVVPNLFYDQRGRRFHVKQIQLEDTDEDFYEFHRFVEILDGHGMEHFDFEASDLGAPLEEKAKEHVPPPYELALAVAASPGEVDLQPVMGRKVSV